MPPCPADRRHITFRGGFILLLMYNGIRILIPNDLYSEKEKRRIQ